MTTAQPASTVGGLLRTWRQRRRYSQQELANRSEVSTRHLSRVETGLAHPSPEMVLHLADHLEIPLRERNQLLLAAGFAPHYQDLPLAHESLAVVMAGLRDLLTAHMPYPALLLDDYWDIVDANAAAESLLRGCDPQVLEPPVNVVRICLHPDGLASRIGDLDQWAAHLHHQAAHRAARTHDPRHHDLVAEIEGYLGRRPEPTATGPVLALELRAASGPLRFFSTSAQLATATDAALEGLHLETFLPADAATRQALR